jgi:murein DD-endopeptidase MepM/ murein hydrolase activator NlpD
MKFFIYSVLAILLIVIIGGAVVAFLTLEGTAPVITPIVIPDRLGKRIHIEAEVMDEGRGLKEVRCFLSQGKKTIELEPKIFPALSWWHGSDAKRVRINWGAMLSEYGLTEGDAQLILTAYDYSWRNSLKGNSTTYKKDVRIDFTPPSVAIKSIFHNINTGGAGMVSYAANEPLARTGVWVNELFFPAYKVNQEKDYAALIAVPFDAKPPIQIVVEAEDIAGNSIKLNVPNKIAYKSIKKDVIHLSDNFIASKALELSSHYSELKGNPLEMFLQINKTIRQKNDDEIRSITLQHTEPSFLFQRPFLRLPNAQARAGFADERHYIYQGKEIDVTNHMGVDLASLEHAPIPAANRGRVVFVGYLGIYGNSVIIDHGMGLFSLYSHLSEFKTVPNNMVEQGDVIGLTGMTGLAGGDHLHYGMLINGIYVNPIEWWDAKWLQERIFNNLHGER